LIFLIVTRAVSLLGLSRRKWWWKDAEILVPQHQEFGILGHLTPGQYHQAAQQTARE
jgi:hypothetical protein